MFYFLVGLMPCYPLGHLLPTFVHHRFPSTPPGRPPLRISYIGFSASSPVAPPPPVSLGCHLTMKYSAASKIPRYHSPAFFAAVDHNAVSTPNTKGATSVDPTAARNSLRFWIMHICQVSNCPPGLEFSPPDIVPNITRQGNRSRLFRATPPAKKRRR